MTILERYKRVVFDSVKQAGQLAPDGLGEARINVCMTLENGGPCKFVGIVEPLPKLKTEGCQQCGCPFDTKPHMTKLLGKVITCPHPEGNKWASIDKTFEI